jgi:hypothetical protein
VLQSQWETFNIPHDGCVPLVGTVAISVPALIWNCGEQDVKMNIL